MAEENRIENTSPEQPAGKPPLDLLHAQTEAGVENSLKSLRTFQGDIQNAIENKHASVSTIAIAEQKRREQTGEPGPSVGTAVKNNLMLYVGGVLVCLGLISVTAIYYLWPRNEAVQVGQVQSLIPYASQTTIDASLDHKAFITAARDRKLSFSGTPNEIQQINVVGADKQPVRIDRITPLLGPTMPAALARSFGTQYMLGIYAFDSNQPFIILTTDDYGASYAGMLKWETTMTDDLGPLFGIEPAGTSTTYTFQDEAVRNKDLRIIKDKNNKTVLLYSFVDKKTLIITANETIFGALLGKYVSSQLVH